jgi:hypothetical protein
MKRTQPSLLAPILRRLWLAAAIGFTALLFDCGGGSVSVAGVGSGGTGAVASGPITGFGSIILNGLRFDDGTASITLDDDNNSTDADLRLGMTVEVEGDLAADGTTGKAASVVGRSFVQGPISLIDMAANQITVLGVTVTVTPGTVYDGADVIGLDTLAVNDVVEIYGLSNGAEGLRATRIERITDERKIEVRLTGTAQNVTPTKFNINGITVQYRTAELVNLPSGVVSGTVVRIKGLSLSDPTEIVASKVRQVNLVPAISERQYAELVGLVTKFTSATDFEMNGLKVNLADSGTITGNPALGSRVEIEGTVSSGILVASRVQAQDESKAPKNGNEVHGKIFSIDQANKTFTMREGSLIVQWNSATTFDSLLPNGEGDLKVDSTVHVEGDVTGNVLLASQIGGA